MLDHGVDVVLHRHVGPDEGGPPAVGLDQRHRLEPVLLVDVGHDDAGTLAGEDEGGSPADPQCTAGDDGHLSLAGPPSASWYWPHTAATTFHRMARFDGKVALVSGAASGIGAAVVGTTDGRGRHRRRM